MPDEPITLGETALAERLQAALALLEKVADDRALLAALSDAERVRFFQAAGKIHTPDLNARRQQIGRAHV